MPDNIKGKIFRRGTEEYERLRSAAIWHAGKPNRYPALIVQAADEDDVVAAVQLAKKEGRKLSVRSGGHSWAGSHLRDDVLLLDLSQLQKVSIDKTAMTATAQPGIKGSEVGEMLRQQGLFFPVGHCTTVCLGGYLLQGGFPWRGQEFGPSCMSVIGIDAVTADGKRVYADEKQNADLFWAARGSGPGFFAVVTQFHLKLYPLQKVTRFSKYIYPPDVWEDALRWARDIGPTLPPEVELNIMMYREEKLCKTGPVLEICPSIYTDSEEKASKTLAVFETCPVRNHVLSALVNEQATTGQLTSAVTESHYPPEKRFIADNMWTHASFDELLPGLRKIHQNFPPPPTHMAWFDWKLTPKRPSMAFSVEDEVYIALYAGWDDPADDKKYTDWVTEHMRSMEHLSTGIQLADENLINRPRRFVTEANLRRLDELRAVYDPNNLFVSWLGRPTL